MALQPAAPFTAADLFGRHGIHPNSGPAHRSLNGSGGSGGNGDTSASAVNGNGGAATETPASSSSSSSSSSSTRRSKTKTRSSVRVGGVFQPHALTMLPFSSLDEQCNPWAHRWHDGFRGPVGAFVSFPLDNPARTRSLGGFTVFDSEVGLATNAASQSDTTGAGNAASSSSSFSTSVSSPNRGANDHSGDSAKPTTESPSQSRFGSHRLAGRGPGNPTKTPA